MVLRGDNSVGDVSGTRVSVCGRGAHKCADEKRSFIVCNPAGMSGIVESEDCKSPPSQAEACVSVDTDGAPQVRTLQKEEPPNLRRVKVCVTALSPGLLAFLGAAAKAL